jgi:hypothetical protein
MKISAIVVAAALALVPASAAFADNAKKEALKKAKDAAKEAAREKAHDRTENLRAAAQNRAASATAAAATPASDPMAAQRERETHARNLGVLERLQQIATSTNNGDLKVIVIRLNGKEDRRHALAQQLNG